MIKYFCDECGEEITSRNKPEGSVIAPGRVGASIKGQTGRLRVEILTRWDGEANGGCFCKYCILDALLKLDDRSRLSK